MKRIKALSLFANVGIGEVYLKQVGIDVCVANELLEERVKFYSHLYPNTEIIAGDITNETTFNQIISSSKRHNVELIIATPPCQGMSTAGKQDVNDPRNLLILEVFKAIKILNPKYVLIENVPEFLKTKILYKNNEKLIVDHLVNEFDTEYNFSHNFSLNACHFSVPQNRERAIILMTRKDIPFVWQHPEQDKKIVTMEAAIGHLPQLDPYVKDISEEERNKLFPMYYQRKEQAEKISKWFSPPSHIYRQVFSLMHTPTGKSAFENIEKFQPKKANGEKVKGFKNTYKRQEWNKPAFTITMYNRTIGSQDNVHPGRYIGKDEQGYDLYSDARVLTIYEILILSSLPPDWNIPSWASDNFIRSVIGEGVPPLLIKKIMKGLVKHNDKI